MHNPVISLKSRLFASDGALTVGEVESLVMAEKQFFSEKKHHESHCCCHVKEHRQTVVDLLCADLKSKKKSTQLQTAVDGRKIQIEVPYSNMLKF